MGNDMDISAVIRRYLDPTYLRLVPGQVTPDTEMWLVWDVVIFQYDQQRGLLPAASLLEYKYTESALNQQQDFT